LGTTQETISVTPGTCNGQQFLPRQLAGNANQTSSPDEIVVSEQESADRSFEGTATLPCRFGFKRDDRERTQPGNKKTLKGPTGFAPGALIVLGRLLPPPGSYH
jgi:hypothetical protein